MANIKQEKAYVTKAKLFYGLLLVLTLAFLITAICIVSNNASYKSYDKLIRKNMTMEGRDLFQLASGEYYIVIFDSENINEKAKSLEPHIVNYFDFYKVNEKKYANEICPIRLLDVSKSSNDRCVSNTTTADATSWTNFTVDKDALPIMICMTSSNGSYSYKVYTTEIDICRELQSTISLIPVAYIPSRKEEVEL